jgi:alpha-galactosidase
MYVEIAQAIKKYAPEAWVINYTNPMAACTGTLYSVFPQIKAFGCCHEVFHAQKLFARILGDKSAKDDVRLNVLGVNHFVWIDRASCGTADLMPMFGDFAKKHAKSGFALEVKDNDPDNPFRNKNKICFDLYRRFGIIPAAGDRHIGEFMPPWYLKNPETAAGWGIGLTTVQYRKEQRERLLEKSARILAGQEIFEIKSSGEDGARQIKALLGLSDMITSVNLPNRGQIAGLPLGAIVETNAVFRRNEVSPLFAGELPPAVNTIVEKHAKNQQLIVEAGINKDTELAFTAFLNDNLMTLDITDAEKLFTEMLEKTSAYLDGWDIGLYKRGR